MPNRLKYLAGLLLIISGLAACEPEAPECYEPDHITTNLNFIKKQVDTVHLVDSTTGMSRDSLVITFPDTLMKSPRAFSLNSTNNVSIIAQPNSGSVAVLMNPDSNAIAYRVQYDSTVFDADTITIYYKPSLHFISNACGYTYYYHIDSVNGTRNVLDSVFILNDAVTNEASTRHIGLYFFQ